MKEKIQDLSKEELIRIVQGRQKIGWSYYLVRLAVVAVAGVIIGILGVYFENVVTPFEPGTGLAHVTTVTAFVIMLLLLYLQLQDALSTNIKKLAALTELLRKSNVIN